MTGLHRPLVSGPRIAQTQRASGIVAPRGKAEEVKHDAA